MVSPAFTRRPQRQPGAPAAITAHRALDPKLVDLLCGQLACEKAAVTEAASLIGDLGADSLDLVELVLSLEDAFGVKISGKRAAGLCTVGDVQSLVISLQK